MGNQFKKPFSDAEKSPTEAQIPLASDKRLLGPSRLSLPTKPTRPLTGMLEDQPTQPTPYPGGQPQPGPVPLPSQQASSKPRQFASSVNRASGQAVLSGPGANMFPTTPAGGRQQGMPPGGRDIQQVLPGNTPYGVKQPQPLFIPQSILPSTHPGSAAWSGPPPASAESVHKQIGTRDKGQRPERRRKKRRVPIWARIVLGILCFCVALGTGGFIYYQVTYAPVLNSVTNKQFTRLKGDVDPNKGKTGSVLNWGRVNILLLGSDTDEKPVWGGNAFLAQTVIVVSVDTNTHDVDMLSIPRDYYIRIPGVGLDKLDTAFSHGGSVNNNMSGVSLVSETLYQDFGIKISFYAWVGLQGFIKVIDTVKGVDVNVMHPVVDDTYPDDVNTKGAAQSGYKRVYIPDGPQHLDGPTALEYVRSRHSTNDFDRSARQQQVLGALKLKLSNPSIFGELPQIAKDLQGSVATSLKPSQIIDFGSFARGIQPDKIKHLTLGGSLYSTSGQVKTPYGVEDVVYPRCDTVPQAIDAFLHINTAVCHTTFGPTPQGSLVSSASSRNEGNILSTMPVSTSLLANNASEPGPGIPAYGDLFGLRDVLALMSMVVLDSPQV